MVIDTSVLLHILFEEAGWQESVAYIMRQERSYISVASIIEAQAVLSGRLIHHTEPLSHLDRIVNSLGLVPHPLTVNQSRIAREAYLKYGKGQGRRAQLNYGDVMSYALACELGDVLAFVGDDFSHTDLEVVRLPLFKSSSDS
jgi:ribonuclease VapC